MATATSHFARERTVLNDLEGSFPDFTTKGLSWVHLQNPDDPPDFLAQGPGGAYGLELREWLDGDQMTEAQGRDKERRRLIDDVLGTGWEKEYQPKNIALATIEPYRGKKIAPKDKAPLRHEFYKCVAEVDQTWFTNPERHTPTNRYHQMEFTAYPLMSKYFQTIIYLGGGPPVAVWFKAAQDGGAFDSSVPIQTLEESLEDKLDKFAKPDWQTRLAKHNLVEHYLLIHGGWNAYKSNTPYHPLRLEDIAKRGAEFYVAHPQRDLFNRVWFFDSLDSADDVNALFGLPAGSGRVRWLAQLWPTFSVYAGSKEG